MLATSCSHKGGIHVFQCFDEKTIFLPKGGHGPIPLNTLLFESLKAEERKTERDMYLVEDREKMEEPESGEESGSGKG